MNTNQLHYPVILFNRVASGTFDIRITEHSLLLTTPLTLQEKVHLNSVIIDTAGCQYDIMAVEWVKQSKTVSLIDTVLNRPIKIHLSLSDDCVPITVEELSSRVRLAFQDKSFADVWEASGINGNAVNTFLSTAANVSDIILYFAQDSVS